MTLQTRQKLQGHLTRYVVDQNYARYTPEDQAVWRYIMRQLKNFLSQHAHPAYLQGLEKTGISVERIPRIEDVDQHLSQIGWGAVAVSGFIPPAAFMEFQALGVLPIASDMRTVDHLLYTPAPDIVHEAAGHAPILVDPMYASYLRKYGEAARRSIISKEDIDQYEAIRILSDIKEDPRSTKPEIAKAERRLNEITKAMKSVSEAALLSRMNWWTAEYGLIGDVDRPRIFGAGLLSSVGESRSCLQAHVRKLPLSIECVDFAYDITEPQPQLFVARDFAQLEEVLNQLAERLSYRRGGEHGLDVARRALTVNTVQLNSEIQISGVLRDFLLDDHGRAIYLMFSGPTQLCYQGQELTGQGIARHSTGYSTPLGPLVGESRCLSQYSVPDLDRGGIVTGQRVHLKYASGIEVDGKLNHRLIMDGKLILLTFSDCTVRRGDQVLFNPNWGEFDLAVGSTLPSVFGGPADRERFGSTEDFAAKRVPIRPYSQSERKRHHFYEQLRELREGDRPASEFRRLVQNWLSSPDEEWLPGVELLELSYKLGMEESERNLLRLRLKPENFASETVRDCVREGVALAERHL